MSIVDGNSKPIFSSGLPFMSDALNNWLQQMVIKVVTKTIVNYQVEETTTDVTTMAVRQPFSAKQLMVKPEGQRQWYWETLHVQASKTYIDTTVDGTTLIRGTDFNLDDIVIFDEVRYRIMAKNNYYEYGFIVYDICQTFEDGTAP